MIFTIFGKDNCVIAHNKFSVSSKAEIVRPKRLIRGHRSEIAIFASKVFTRKPFTAARDESIRFNASLSHSDKRLITENEVLKEFFVKITEERILSICTSEQSNILLVGKAQILGSSQSQSNDSLHPVESFRSSLLKIQQSISGGRPGHERRTETENKFTWQFFSDSNSSPGSHNFC